MRARSLFWISSFSMLLGFSAFFAAPLRAEGDVRAGDKLLLSLFVGSGKGQVLVVCDPAKHLLYAYEMTAKDEIYFKALRDYTYDLLIDDYMADRDRKKIPTGKPGEILKYLREKRYKADPHWRKEVKEKKISRKKPREQRRLFREWLRKKCRASSGKTRLLSLETFSPALAHLIVLFDEANSQVLFFKYDAAAGFVLTSSRDIEADLGLGEYVSTVNNTAVPTVEQIKKLHESYKKKDKKSEEDK